MTQFVEIAVVNTARQGLPGIPIQSYNGDTVYTDDNGLAILMLEHVSTTIYVNGFTAYEGSVADLGLCPTFLKTGERID